jgi:hypothetical protein
MEPVAIRKIFSVAMLILAPLSLPSQANATLVFEDWTAPSDHLVTKDTISGLEWLNFSQTTTGHQAVRAGLQGTYDGFRFATTDELLGLFLNYVPGLDPGGFMFGSDPQISSDLQFVMDFLGYDDDQFLFVNTCAHATGCDPIGFGAGEGIGRHILRSDPASTAFAVFFGDDSDFTDVQALVRIPTPGTGGLFVIALAALAAFGSRARRKTSTRASTRVPTAGLI